MTNHKATKHTKDTKSFAQKGFVRLRALCGFVARPLETHLRRLKAQRFGIAKAASKLK